MNLETKSLKFSVAGDFVTKTAREWFWYEQKPWATVEELLLSCMCGTSQTEDELKSLARDVVYGRAKFIGNTSDGSYALVDDNQDIVIQNVEYLVSRARKAEAEYQKLTESYVELTERIQEKGYEWLLEPKFGHSDEMSPTVQSFFEARKAEEKFGNNYGWLEPSGDFHPVDWGSHEDWAWKTINERGWRDEFSRSSVSGIYARGDFLVNDKGWVLLHNPSLGTAVVTTSNDKPLTKAQREFLYGYYADRGKDDLAQSCLEEY